MLPATPPTLATISAALSHRAYEANRVRLTGAAFDGATCLMASRQGVFALGCDGLVIKLVHGFFFGIRAAGDKLYLFEACDRPWSKSRRGRIVRLRRDGAHLCDPAVLATGLDNQCHQLALFDGSIWLTDTRNQQIVQFAPDGTELARRMPIPLARGDDPRGGYVHLNGLAQIGGEIAAMLHNGVAEPGRPSEVAWFDRDWNLLRRDVLPGHGCHDIVADAAGTLWHCGSMAGEVINSAGLRQKVGDGMTRGLALAEDRLVVGRSYFATRSERSEVAGQVHFFDGDLRPLAAVAVPGAPTDLLLL